MAAKPEYLQSEQCCLFVVDPQERLLASIHEADRVVKNIDRMVELAKVLAIPIIASTQYKKGIGPLVEPLATKLAEVPCPDKFEFGALNNADVRAAVEALPPTVDTLVICGVESHVCIYQTVIGALQKGYKVWVVADGVSSRTKENDRYGRRRMASLGAILAPAEMIIYELLQKAGTPAFKAMLPHVK